MSKRPRDRIDLCVGTTRLTTPSRPSLPGSSYFSRIFLAEWAEEESEIFLDRDAEPFSILLSCACEA